MLMRNTMKSPIEKVPAVIKLANAEDETTGDAYEIFEFTKLLGRRGTVRIDRDQARQAEKVLNFLIRKNWDAPEDEVRAVAIVAAAIRNSPQQYLLHARHLGWRRGRKAFVLQKKVIGAATRQLKLTPPLWLNDRQLVVMRAKGDLQVWIKKIARPMRYSNSGMLILSAAFAAPLLQFAGLQSFGINLFGPAKAGKTTLLLAASSGIGIARESQLPNWNTTVASFQETARLFNDLLLPANKVGLLAGRKGDAYPKLRQLVYIFSEGRDTSRHSSSSAASMSSSATWRGVFVSTAEHSLNTYAAFSGEQRDHGEFARCLDVPAVRGGSSTVFDRGPKTLSTRDFERWTRNKLISIREACERNHGKVIRPYIEHLIANVDAVKSTVRSRIAEFEKTVNASALDGALQHAAKNFGLIFAGGCLGIDAKLLPWDRGRLLRAVAASFEDALRKSKAHENTATKGRKRLRKNLSSANLAEHTPSAKFGPNDRSGFWEKNNGVLIYTIHAKVFRRWFHNQAQLAATLNWLERDGFLVLSRKKSPSNNPGNTEWAEQSPRWPSGNNVRSIVFRDPFDGEAIPQSLKNR